MNELVIEGPIMLQSPNGKWAVKLMATDDGSLVATLFERDAGDPNKWRAASGPGVSAHKFLLRTWRDAGGKLARVE